MSHVGRRRTWITFILFVLNFLVHYSECHGNFNKETVLTPSQFNAQLSGNVYFRPPIESVQKTTKSNEATPWEYALKYSTYLALSEIGSGGTLNNADNTNDTQTTEDNHHNKNQLKSNSLQKDVSLAAIESAQMVDFQQRRVPQFGDIIMLAMGRLEHNADDNSYRFVESLDICSEEHINPECIKNMPKNVVSIWSVQKIRRRDEHRNYKFELRFGIYPIREHLTPHSSRSRKSIDEFRLRQFVIKQEDYPNLFESGLDRKLKKRTDFFEGIDEDPIHSDDMYDDRSYGDSIDRTLFDLIPFFDDRSPRMHNYHRNPAQMNSAYRYNAYRPQASSSEMYNYFAQPQTRVPVYKKPVYNPYNPLSQSPYSGLQNTFQTSPSNYYKPQQYYKMQDYMRLAGQQTTPANYQFYNVHPSASQVQPSVLQPEQNLLQTQQSVQQYTVNEAPQNPMANYFLNRNRMPAKAAYYQRPFVDYKTAESVQQPKKAIYYTNLPGSYEVAFGGQNGGLKYREPINSYATSNQKFLPLPQQQTPQSVNIATQPYLHTSIPFPPNYHHPVQTHQHGQYQAQPQSIGNPFFFQHMQMVTPSGVQQPVPQFQPQIISQVSIPPMTGTRMTTTFRFPPSFPLQQITMNQPQLQQQSPNTIPFLQHQNYPQYHHQQITPHQSIQQQPQIQLKSTTIPHKDIFQGVRSELQTTANNLKFSEPDPLYHKQYFTTPTSFTKVTATPKISYFFPKEEEADFKPMVPNIRRRNFTEFDNIFKYNDKKASISKLSNSKPVNNIIYGQNDNKVQPPTVQPEDTRPERIKVQLPAPTKSSNSSFQSESSFTTARTVDIRPHTTMMRRVSSTSHYPHHSSTPMNLITQSGSSSTSTTTTPPPTTTTSSTTTTLRSYTPRGGRHYSRGKSNSSTSTEKPVLKWMPKRKRLKADNSTKIASTLNNAVFFQPTISNRTRVAFTTAKPPQGGLDDVNLSPEEPHYPNRRQEKLVQTTPDPLNDMAVEQSKQNTVTVPRNKKRKQKHNFTNFVTIPTTTTMKAELGDDEVIPEPQKNVLTTTKTPYLSISNATSDREIFVTTIPPFVPILPTTENSLQFTSTQAPEVIEMVKADLKTIAVDSKDVKLFKASSDDLEIEDEPQADDNDEEDGLDLLAKTIVAHAKKVFSSDIDDINTITGAGSESTNSKVNDSVMREEED